MPAPVVVRAPVNENGRAGEYVADVGSVRGIGRPLTNGRVDGRRESSLSGLSIMCISVRRVATRVMQHASA
jgi:hypothetical protein